MKTETEIRERIKELEDEIAGLRSIPGNKFTYDIMFLTRDIVALKWVLGVDK